MHAHLAFNPELRHKLGVAWPTMCQKDLNIINEAQKLKGIFTSVGKGAIS